MLLLFFITAFFFTARLEALECGITDEVGKYVTQQILICLKNATVLQDTWTITQSFYDEMVYKSSEELFTNTPNFGESNSTFVLNNVRQNLTQEIVKSNLRQRSKRQNPIQNHNKTLATPNFENTTKNVNITQEPNVNTTFLPIDFNTTLPNVYNISIIPGNITENHTAVNTNVITTTPEPLDEKCVINCVLQQLKMTGQNGIPEHSKFSEELIKSARNVELHDFIQDSIDFCFQEMREYQQNPCEYSTRLVMCLADRGKANCADWPIGNIPLPI